MGIDYKKLGMGISLCTGRLSYRDISGIELLAFKVDKVVSLDRETPCWLMGETDDGDGVSQVWIKNGREIEDSNELTDNRYILPMSQWGEEE